jgi:hypothetical protein
VVGAGAAGIFAALAARGALDAKGRLSAPPAGAPRVLLLDSRPDPGRKILISGGGRCNVTNASVTDRDFDTDAPAVVRGLLAGFPVASVRAFFEGRGVPLAEEPMGKLFPADGNAKEVLAALLGALGEAGVERAFGTEVGSVERDGEGWRLGDLRAGRVVVATGGRSVPRTGSTGFGYGLAASLGHAVVEPVPALAALTGRTPPVHSGTTLPAILTVEDPDGRVLRRSAGSLLFTHRGVSGPAALDASLAVARALREERPFRVRADLWTLSDPAGPFGPYLGLPKPPGACLPECPAPATPHAVDREILAAAGARPAAALGEVLGERLPRRVVEALVPAARTPLGRLSREDRRAAAGALAALDLRIEGAEGFERAEVTAGGVPLRELDRRTLESRRAPGIRFCGEVCHATGRLGGFNFQWAWSSGFAAGRGA